MLVFKARPSSTDYIRNKSIMIHFSEQKSIRVSSDAIERNFDITTRLLVKVSQFIIDWLLFMYDINILLFEIARYIVINL